MKTMQKKKIVAGITAIVVLALLFAGVGYAFSGTARTYNQGDEQTLAYMSVTPDDFNPIFVSTNGGTIFDTYVYQGATLDADPLIAYAFNVDEETVVDLTANATTYKAVALNNVAKTLTVENQTGDSISKLNVAINATGTVGNTDFVYIFKLQVVGDTPENTKYIVFNGNATGNVDITPLAAIADEGTKDIAVTVYVGYVANVYVPNNYIGPASGSEKQEATVWTSGVTYYSDVSCENVADPQPADQEDLDAGTFYEKLLPYRQTTTAPIDLATTGFGIVVTDATPAP